MKFAVEHTDCCEARRCQDQGCGLTLPRPPRRLVSGTRFQEEHRHTNKLCDYILYWEPQPDSCFLATIELKTGNLKMGDIARQLQAGATLAESLLPDSGEPRFAAILAKRQRMHPEDRKVLNRLTVRFRKTQYPIRVLGCGATIESAFPR